MGGGAGADREATKERELLENMLKKKIVSTDRGQRARKAHADATDQLDEIVTGTERTRAQEYSNVPEELATLKQNLKATPTHVEPDRAGPPAARPIVNNLSVTTNRRRRGRPGEEILQIIPLDEECS